MTIVTMCDLAAESSDVTELVDFDMPDGGVSPPDPAALGREKSTSVYLSVISQQTFIGCWKLNSELSQLLDVSLDQLQNSAPVKVSHNLLPEEQLRCKKLVRLGCFNYN